MPTESNFPFVKKSSFFDDPFQIYRRLRGEGGAPSVLLESARTSSKMGRYSLSARNPFLIFESKGSVVTLRGLENSQNSVTDPFEALRDLLRRFAISPQRGFPPFCGGVVGYVGYEAKNLIEPSLTQKAIDDIRLPDIYFLFFDEGIILDHEKEESYFFANVFSERNPKKALKKAAAKVDRLEKDSRDISITRRKTECVRRIGGLEGRCDGIEHSFSRRGFMNAVLKAKEHIREGDIYQANLSQRFSFPVEADPLEIYSRLKEINPSPFFGILDAVDFQIISGSPERLVKCQDRVVETRPIAGTRPRGKTAAGDSAIALDLILNQKERAEHIMLVDLERNDLGRVCEFGSVSVDELMAIEDYSHVKHIVSNVRGDLREGLDAVDVLKALFPGGTITGAPKVRCMEIIDDLEPVARGPYTGSLGYLSFTGNMDFNIIIRSLVLKEQKGYLQVGAGIVADSVPRKEYDETLYKAQAIFAALFGKDQTAAFLRKCHVAAGVS